MRVLRCGGCVVADADRRLPGGTHPVALGVVRSRVDPVALHVHAELVLAPRQDVGVLDVQDRGTVLGEAADDRAFRQAVVRVHDDPGLGVLVAEQVPPVELHDRAVLVTADRGEGVALEPRDHERADVDVQLARVVGQGAQDLVLVPAVGDAVVVQVGAAAGAGVVRDEVAGHVAAAREGSDDGEEHHLAAAHG